MEKLEIKTRKGTRTPNYLTNVDSCTVFLKHSEDRIEIQNHTEQETISIYDNGKRLFSGNKYELYQILKDIAEYPKHNEE